jgi:hypothetical protein
MIHLEGDTLIVPVTLDREPDREVWLTLTRDERQRLRDSLDWADAYGPDHTGYVVGGRG